MSHSIGGGECSWACTLCVVFCCVFCVVEMAFCVVFGANGVASGFSFGDCSLRRMVYIFCNMALAVFCREDISVSERGSSLCESSDGLE